MLLVTKDVNETAKLNWIHPVFPPAFFTLASSSSHHHLQATQPLPTTNVQCSSLVFYHEDSEGIVLFVGVDSGQVVCGNPHRSLCPSKGNWTFHLCLMFFC